MCDALIKLMEEVSGKKMDDLVAEKVAVNYPIRLEEKVEEEFQKLLDKKTEEVTKIVEKKIMEQKLESIKSVMQTLNLSSDQAMDILQIPSSEKDKYKKILC